MQANREPYLTGWASNLYHLPQCSEWNQLTQQKGIPMEISTTTAAELLGISRTQLHRYGNEGKVSFRTHGPRGRRRYNLEQLRRDARLLKLSLDEERLRKITQESHQLTAV